jgi:hypothetical protein
MSGSAPAYQKLMQFVHHRNPYSALPGRGPVSYREMEKEFIIQGQSAI